MRSVQGKSSETGQSGAEFFCSAADQATKGLQSGHHGQVCSRSISPRTSLSRHLPSLPESTDNQSLSSSSKHAPQAPATRGVLGVTGSPRQCATGCAIGTTQGDRCERTACFSGRDNHDGVGLLIALRGRLGGAANKAQPAIKTTQIANLECMASLSIVPKLERLLALGSVVPFFRRLLYLRSQLR